MGKEPLPEPVVLAIKNADPPGCAVRLPAALTAVLTDGFRRAAQFFGDPPAAPASRGETKDRLDILWSFQRRIPEALLLM